MGSFLAEKIPLQILEFKGTVHDLHYSSRLNKFANWAKNLPFRGCL